MARIALVTCREPGEHVRDQAPTVAVLEAHGHQVEVVAWDDPAPIGDRWPEPELDRFDLVLPRSTWNYHLHAPAFLRWIDRAAQLSEVWNRPAAIRANHHKRYLTALAEREVRTVPTLLIPRGAGVGLAALRSARGWSEVVIKPAVGASSFATRAFEGAGARGRSGVGRSPDAAEDFAKAVNRRVTKSGRRR